MNYNIFFKKNKKSESGFTLIELLFVIAIIGLLSTVVLASLGNARKKSRDTKRIQDMRQIQTALEFYYDDNGRYPYNTDNDCGGWDVGFNGGAGSGDPFIQPLETGGYMSKVSGDITNTSNCNGYRYYRYGAGSAGCDVNKGAFYILGVIDMEDSGRPHPDSPGFSCPSRNWQNEFDWVVGSFENI